AETVRNHELAHRRLTHSEVEERTGNHPGNQAAVLEHGARERTHEPHAAPSVHEAPVSPCHLLAQLHGDGEILRVDGVAGAAEDRDGADHHAGSPDEPTARPCAMPALRRSPDGFARRRALPRNRSRSSSSLMATIRAAPG